MAFTWSRTIASGTTIDVSGDIEYDPKEIDTKASTIPSLHCPTNYVGNLTSNHSYNANVSYDSGDYGNRSDYSNCSNKSDYINVSNRSHNLPVCSGT